MNIYSGLLFLQGHITHVDLARQLAGVEAAPRRPPQRVSGRRHAAQPELAMRRVRVRHGNGTRAPMPECADACAATHVN